MRLPFQPPLEPMLAKAAPSIPIGDGWLYEPKWDGFRAIVFRDGDETLIQSRDLQLVVAAGFGRAVGAPTEEGRRVSEAVALEVIVGDLDDALRPQRLP